jgi:hypothetical protein
MVLNEFAKFREKVFLGIDIEPPQVTSAWPQMGRLFPSGLR